MQFSDIIGQQEIKQNLVELVQHNRLSHALLFLGKEGNGAFSLARALAQYLNCEKVNQGSKEPEATIGLFGEEPAAVLPTEPINDSCGVCRSCQKSKQLVHPDIHFSFPVIPKKAGQPPISDDYISEWREFITLSPYGNVYDWLQFLNAENKQGNITAAECNDIIRKLSLKSFENGYKILLMWMPEYLGNEGNKLLKLIEEPPAETLFILVAENEAGILPTILSRCQLIKIPAIESSEIEQALIKRNNTPAAQASLLAAVSEGNYRDAILQSQHAGEDWQTLLREWLNAIAKKQPLAQTKWVDEASKLGREKQKQFLRFFNHLLGQAIRLQALGEENIILSDAEKDFLIRLNKLIQYDQQQAIVEELDKAAYYIERNANAKMLFHALTIKLSHIIHNRIVLG